MARWDWTCWKGQCVVNPSRATVIQFTPTYHLRTHLVRYSTEHSTLLFAPSNSENLVLTAHHCTVNINCKLTPYSLLTFPEYFNRRLLVFSSLHAYNSSCLLFYTCTYSELYAHHFNSCSGLCKHFMGNWSDLVVLGSTVIELSQSLKRTWRFSVVYMCGLTIITTMWHYVKSLHIVSFKTV